MEFLKRRVASRPSSYCKAAWRRRYSTPTLTLKSQRKRIMDAQRDGSGAQCCRLDLNWPRWDCQPHFFSPDVQRCKGVLFLFFSYICKSQHNSWALQLMCPGRISILWQPRQRKQLHSNILLLLSLFVQEIFMYIITYEYSSSTVIMADYSGRAV
jgi:hypothetical protein